MARTSDQSITEALADLKVKSDAARIANEGALFAGEDIRCFDCAGMALQGSIVLGRKGQKSFIGMHGSTFHRLEGDDLAAERASWASFGMTLSCECGRVVD